MKKKINIGFDIGITSVGWAIVDEENNIIDRGVRLFEELKNPKDGKLKNQERRTKRSARRMISRRRNRKDDFIKLITKKYYDIFKIQWLEDFDKTKENFLSVVIGKNTNISILNLILKGLKEELEPLLLVRILYYYLSHRGYSYMTIDQYEKKNGILNIIDRSQKLKDFASWYENNNTKDKQQEIELKAEQTGYKDLEIKTLKSFLSQIKTYNKEKEYLNKFPSVVQKSEFNKYGYFRGNDAINGSFSKIQWEEEIRQVLGNQKYLPKEFIIDYLGDDKENKGIFNRLRDFSEGPGSEKSPTKYGLYREENGRVEKVAENLWDLTIGKCSVFPDQDRANKKSCSAEISNILNQLNTITIDNSNRLSHKLTEKEKKEIIYLLVSKNINPLKCIAEVCQTAISNIFKYPTKESKKNKSTENQNLEKLENTKLLFSFLHEDYNIDNFDSLFKYKELFNNIIDVFAKYPNQLEKVENELVSNQKIRLDLSKAKELVKASKKINSQSTSSMSLKALDLYINEELKDDGQTLNQKFKSKIDENEISKFRFNGLKSKYINEDCLDDQNFILSPTTKCSFRETLKVFNKILKRYVYNPSNENKETYFIKNIVMEMPTEWNSVDERKRKTDIKNYNEECKRIVKEQFDYEGDDKNIIKKLVLFHLQNHIDVYSGESMDHQQIIDNPNYAEIDHIIPYSISYDDSNNNKVLVLRSSNQEKGRRTPKEYMDNKRFYAMKNKWEKIFLTEGSETYNKKKFENLCVDLGSDDIRRFAGFIGRNLADTRYACRIAKQALDSWLDSPEIKNNLSNGDINIITVNGKYTQRYRGQKYLNIPKDREEDYSHHAIDATICAILGNSNENVGKLVWFRDVNHETGEVKSKSKFITLYHDQKIKKSDEDIKWNDLTNSVLNHNVKFSYKINKKNNFGFWGDSIISVKEGKDEDGSSAYYKQLKFELLPKDFKKEEFEKKFKKINEFYENGEKYPDPKLWKDLLNAYEEGKKIQELDENLKKENPFKLYMKKYYEINELIHQKEYKSVILERKNKKGNIYKYQVRKIIDKPDKINSFFKTKSLSNDRFGAYTGMEWKEIRLFKDDKGKYRVIPMRINLYTNHLENKIDIKKYNELKNEFNISIDKFYKIHKGTLMINKNNSKDIRKIVGGDFIQNKLDIQEIYKKSSQNNVAISTIMENYYFCNVDELGNVTIIKDLGI